MKKYVQKMNLFSYVSLSAKITVKRVEDIGRDIKRQLENKAKNSKWFSLAIDTSTDINDTVVVHTRDQ